MEKYPLLRGLAGLARIVGWLGIIGGGGALLVGALVYGSTFQTNQYGTYNSDPMLAAKSIFAMAGGAIFFTLATLLALIGEVIKVFIDIEDNTGQALRAIQNIAGTSPTRRSELQLPERIEPVMGSPSS